jgi:hypothetical protein
VACYSERRQIERKARARKYQKYGSIDIKLL